jgi:type IV pilus assembly protein PilC
MTTATTTKTRTYDYEALDAAGKRTKGKVEATTDSAAAAALRAQGVMPLKLTESGRGLQKEINVPGFGNRVTVRDLAVLARQFATMTSSGLSLLRSLAILEEQTPKPKLAQALRDVRRDIESGTSLSGALAKQDRIFPRLMIAMIAAGETGGFLDQALDRIAVNFEKDANLRGKIKSAMTYPMLVVGFSILMLVAVLVFIVPVFEHMFANLGGKLPLPTQILVTISHQIWWILPITVAGVIAFVSWFRKKLHDDPAWRLGFDKFKLRLPVFGTLFTKIAISRFARNLGTLLHVGVPVLQALDIVGATTGNAVIAEAMKDVGRSVRDGQTMSAPLERHPIFPAMVTNMMQVGEETGQMSAMLDKVSDFYDHEVEAATDSLTAAIEPVMVVLMGAIIGAMVVCLYLPMFTIYQHIQGAS